MNILSKELINTAYDFCSRIAIFYQFKLQWEVFVAPAQKYLELFSLLKYCGL